MKEYKLNKWWDSIPENLKEEIYVELKDEYGNTKK